MNADTATDDNFSMISEDRTLVIHIGDETLIYFEEAVPMSDDEDTKMTQMVRDVLFGRPLTEVLDGRNMTVTYAITTMSMPPQALPISIKVLFETAMTLPADIDYDDNIECNLPIDIYPIEDLTLPGNLIYIFPLNGEVVVDGNIIDAPAPFHCENNTVMVPLRAIAEAIGLNVYWQEETQSVRIGVGISIYLGQDRYEIGRMVPIELGVAPELVGSHTFVPLTFFQEIISGYTAFVFEGQVVVVNVDENDME
jgi:hypothetical protein